MLATKADWDHAVEQFTKYLPSEITHWIVALELPAHQEILRRLVPRLGSTEVFVLGESPPDAIRDVGTRHLKSPDVGFIEFAVHDGRADHGGIDYGSALMTFARWPSIRLRLCFDVWDETFPVLFAERPDDVKDRCHRTRTAVEGNGPITYRPAFDTSSGLILDCTGSEWVEYSGLEDYDYMLPSGEVACLPKAVDGVLEVDGWIIGTLPFGLKYGRISPGELVIEFKEGTVAGITGSSTSLREDFATVIGAISGLRTVAEVGLGQSYAASEAVKLCEPAYQWHERHYGLHLGLGAELPETLDPDHRRTNHHVDIVLATGTLSVDGKELLRW